MKQNCLKQNEKKRTRLNQKVTKQKNKRIWKQVDIKTRRNKRNEL